MATPGSVAPIAFVVVKPRGGVPQEPPSTRNLAEWRADPQDVARVREHFASLGFEVSSGSDGSLSIAGPAALFESCFGVRPRSGPAGTFRVGAGGAPASALPLGRLPAELRRLIHAAGFAEAPDFGPGSFS